MGDYRDRRRPEPEPKPVPKRRVPKPLTEAEMARVLQTKSDIHTHLPEMVPVIKEFQEAGLIDGWRNVTFIKRDDNGTA